MQPLAYFLLFFSSSSVCLIGMEAVVRNDQVIGFIRRADYGFFIDRPIAYGYVLIATYIFYALYPVTPPRPSEISEKNWST